MSVHLERDSSRRPAWALAWAVALVTAGAPWVAEPGTHTVEGMRTSQSLVVLVCAARAVGVAEVALDCHLCTAAAGAAAHHPREERKVRTGAADGYHQTGAHACRAEIKQHGGTNQAWEHACRVEINQLGGTNQTEAHAFRAEINRLGGTNQTEAHACRAEINRLGGTNQTVVRQYSSMAALQEQGQLQAT